MSSFFDIFAGLVASYLAVSLQSYFTVKGNNDVYLLYIVPVFVAMLIIILLLYIKKLFLYIKRPLKKHEGFWIESITNSKVHSGINLISIMKLYFRKGNYWIIGESLYEVDSEFKATWKSEKVFLCDEHSSEVDYIYKADMTNSPSGTRGYAKIKFENTSGFIIDIDQELNQKQHFDLHKIRSIKDLESFNEQKLSIKNKEIFKKFLENNK